MILLNKIQCNHCLDTIVSHHIHDFRYCSCGTVAVDGGHEYLRRTGGSEYHDYYKELSVMDNGDHNTRRENLHWGVNYSKENERLPATRWTLVKDLETDHIEAIFRWFEERGRTMDPFYEKVFRDELEWRAKNQDK